MAADQLLVNVLSVSNLGGGASVTLAHGLRVRGAGVVPTQVLCDRASPLTVGTVTATSITVTNPTGSPLTANFRVEYDHSLHAIGATPTKWQGIPFAAAAGAAVYGSFSDSTDQALSGTPLDVRFDTVEASVGVTVANDPVTGRASRLTVASAGVYAFTISPQLSHNAGGGAELVAFYAVTQAGTLVRSASYLELGNNNRATLPYLELLVPMPAGGWLQWWFASTPGSNILLDAIAAAGGVPAAPSVIAGVKLIGA